MRTRKNQQGAGLLIFVAVLILGVSWYTIDALGKASPLRAERESATGRALQEGKRALLAHVAQYAARSSTAEPGQLPCPESPSLANPGEASSSCSATALEVGRLPWKTLGIEQLRDGEGEPLWYMMRGFRNPPINFGTAGQLTYNGAAVVALIIAPGKPVSTLAEPGTPPAGCSKLDQQVATRNTATLNPANFLECGVATGSITSPGDARWTNDRVIAITANEWADAIAGAIADRLQRQVAPAIETYRNTTSALGWGQNFLPNASNFNSSGTNPPSNNMCGNAGVREGMPPTASVASGLCNTNWSSWSGWGVDLGVSLSFGGCAQQPTYLRCTYTVLLGGVAPSPWIVATASRIGYSFRRFDPATIVVIRNGAPVPNAVRNYSAWVSSVDGSGTIQFEIQFPLLSLIDTLEVQIPYADDALLADARSAWYVNNGWDRFTYYGVSRASTHDPGTSVCNPGVTVTGCLTVDKLPTPNDDKRFVLVLMGPRAVSGQTWPGASPAAYLEGENATTGDRRYEATTVSYTATVPFNDRVAACPLQSTSAAGPPPVTIC